MKLLEDDHFSAKILQDNRVIRLFNLELMKKKIQIFHLIKLYGHDWKWNEEDGLIILHKKTPTSSPEFVKWSDVLPSIKIRQVEFNYDYNYKI